MKILSVEQIRQADAYTVQNEPITSLDLMERAATKLFEWFYKRVSGNRVVKIFCGMGNNGGDGLALARLLSQHDIVPQVFIVYCSSAMSADCDANCRRLENETQTPIFEIHSDDDFPKVNANDIIVDALFGSGLNRPLEGLAADLIFYLNQTPAIGVAIDIPSGMFADCPSDVGAVFKADYTLTFQFPKLAFLFPENDAYVGRFEVLDIALHHQFIDEVTTANFYTTASMIKPLLHARTKYSHKGTYGHALLIAGSAGKIGAALLSARSCMRAGVGLLSVHLPKGNLSSLLSAIPEAMADADSCDACFSEYGDLDAYSAIGIGPGLGRSEQTVQALKRLIQDAQVPLVMDADALNILSENPNWLPFLPGKTILTPHIKEFERMAGKASDSFDRLERQRAMSMKFGIIIVLKGAYSSITFPNGSCFFNTTGNPGMATAGSGDVLTGIILSLLAQRYLPEEAAIIGVYLHGLAGDIAAERIGVDALLASDITENIGKAYMQLRAK